MFSYCFATVTTTLIINGTSTISGNTESFENGVIFTSATTDTNGIAIIEANGKSINFTSKTLQKLGDVATLNFEISNLDKNYDAEATIACVFINADETETSTNDLITLALSKTTYSITSGGKDTGVLTATLDHNPEVSTDINIKCTVTATAEERTSAGTITPASTNNTLSGIVTDSTNTALTSGYLAIFSDTMKVATIGTDGSFSVSDLEDGVHEIYYMGTTDPTNLTKANVKSAALASGTFTTSMTSETITLSKGDTKYYINNVYVGAPSVPAAVSFETDSWETIATAVKSETYPYNVGDTKTIDMGDLGTHTVRVANTSTCTNGVTSETACGFVVEFADIITEHAMNSTDTNVGGWQASEMRTYVNGTIYTALPSDLQSVIAETTVLSGHGSKSGEINFTSRDKLYLLNAQEVWGTNDYDTSVGTSRQLDYYANLGVTASSYSGVIKKYNGSASVWWLRSARGSDDYSFLRVDSFGSWSRNAASNTHGVSPAFRIG